MHGMITAIIPASPDERRQSDTLERAIASVRAQTHPVDNLLVLRGLRNTVARNMAAREADTEWLGFLDDDDYWMPDAVEHVLPLAAKADCIFGNPTTNPTLSLSANQQWGLLKQGVVFVGSSGLFIRRDAFLSVGGFDESLETGDVFALMLRLRVAGARVLHLPRATYHKELSRGDNLTHTKPLADLINERRSILESVLSDRLSRDAIMSAQ